jgi:O-antigen/teichoic acid export membrane protein
MDLTSAGLSFLVTLQIAHVLGKAMLGEFSYAVTLGTFCMTIALFGLDRTLVRDLVQQPRFFRQLIGYSIYVRAVLLLAVTVGFSAYLSFSRPDGPSTFAIWTITAATALRCMNLQSAYDACYRFKTYSALILAKRVVDAGLITWIFLNFGGQTRLHYIGTVMLATEALSTGIQYRLVLNRLKPSQPLQRQFLMIRGFLEKNFPIWVAGLCALLISSLNQIILKHYQGSAELGSYAAAWQLTQVAILALTQITRLNMPSIAKLAAADLPRRVRLFSLGRHFAFVTVAASILSLPAVICPSFVIGFLYPARFADSAAVLRLGGLYAILYGAGLVLSQYVLSAKLHRAYCLSLALGAFSSTLLTLYLVRRYSAIGAGLSLLLSHGAAIGLYGVVALRHVFRHPAVTVSTTVALTIP